MDGMADGAQAAAGHGIDHDDTMDIHQSPAGTDVAEPMPAAFPKKRRGRPPGRPNMTVREADYEENALVQAWNAAKTERPLTVVAVNIRAALTENALVHDTQRAIFRKPSRETIYFVQGWITARHIASQRPSYVNGLLIHSRGEDASDSCVQCAERRAKNALGPFLTCRTLPGSYHNSCSNCKWFDNTSVCSLYTGPKPNRKRKAKDLASAVTTTTTTTATSAGEPAEEDPDAPLQHLAEGSQGQQTPDEHLDPSLDQHGEVDMHQSDSHFEVMDEIDGNSADG